MRLLLILTVLLLSTKSYTQDIVDIPDPNFKQALIDRRCRHQWRWRDTGE
ncbi:MAG: hypothetical protein H6572_10425 [Lewinellaceae bacterium]|nr:hypothetical protein [Lewinellaceae bacterium]